MMNKKISVTIAIIACIINAYLMGQYSGFEQGYNYTLASYKECVGMGFSGWTIYFSLSNYHFFILFFLIVFAICKAIGKKLLSQIICFFSLILVLFKYGQWWYLGIQNIVGDNDSFYDLIRRTIILDWFCIFIVLVLLIYQITTSFQYYFDWKRNKLNIE